MAVLPGARDFVLNVQGDLIDNSPAYKMGPGLKALLKASSPEAAHDSPSHPASCLEGTRLQYIEDITHWALAIATERRFRMMWMEGPAGVGKSTLAQSCANGVGAKLAAAFFFSRPNSLDDSTRLFPSIAYQLARKYPSYRDKLDKKVSNDPTLVHTAIDIQFRELIVVPFQELREEGRIMDEGVVFIDGLDECDGDDAQCHIIDTISASVRGQNTPFIWGFFSRPEPRIVTQFAAPHVHDLCWKLSLPVSHDADGDIELYLQGGFRTIRAQYGIPPTVAWPSNDEIRELVRRSAGLFTYPTSVIRFVGKGGPLGPEGMLRSVLRLPSKLVKAWSYLDAFYTLIMKRIPKDMLPSTLKLLSLTCARGGFGRYSRVATEVLGLSFLDYCAALSKLHSVAKLVYAEDGYPAALQFYHASFMDFLVDPERSGEFCVESPEICTLLLADAIRCFNRGPSDHIVKIVAFDVFWEFGSNAKLDEGLLRQLAQCDYRNMTQNQYIARTYVNRFFDNANPFCVAKEGHATIPHVFREEITIWKE